MKEASERIQKYFDEIERDVNKGHTIATTARKQGFDPEEYVEIKLAKNMAERVEGLISTVAPNLIGVGVPERIIEMEKEYSPLDWRVALKIALEVAQEKFCKFKDKKEAMEVGIRTGFAYQTAGIVAAPLEGFIELKIKKTYDNKEYFAPCYAGPIRGAGGTAAAFSLLLTDYVRSQMGFAKYDPSEHEINRYKTEIYDYHERITNLQYLPSLEELDFLLRHLPIQVDGDPTEIKDVSNYKDAPRVETNKIRGGICLVLAEGLSQKAPKLWKRLEKWGAEFGLEWDFLADFLKLQKKIKAKQATSGTTKKSSKLSPNYTFITDMVAGRPVLTHPMASGGFRLRYGRARTTGFSAAAINPATMIVLNKFIAIGTQLKVERPGKAAAITSCDTIHGPTVLLKSGNVIQLETLEEAKKYNQEIKEIIYLGDMLFNYGDFSENGHILAPVGYNEDWWLQQLKRIMAAKGEELTKEQKTQYTDPKQNISFAECRALSEKYNIPLHPNYTYYWTQISNEQFKDLLTNLKDIKIMENKLTFPFNDKQKLTIEKLGIPHLLVNKEFVVIENDHAKAFLFSLGIEEYEGTKSILQKLDKEKTVLQNINCLCSIAIKDKAGTTIGARMGRPEKAKMRKLTGSPQILFPVGAEGGRMRSFQSAMQKNKINADFPLFKCHQCQKEQIFGVCHDCGTKTKKVYFCMCGKIDEPTCPTHGNAKTFKKYPLPISENFLASLRHLKMTHYPDLIKGIRGTSNEHHTVEYLGKGILRAKHDIYVNKDGTIRYDMSELPVTHFKPIEIGTPIEKLRALGYKKDIEGALLTDSRQICELLPQDIILPAAPDALDEPCDAVLFRVAKCIDEMLEKIYKLPPFYRCESKEDLVGHLTICLAPHISAGMVGRIIGFSKTQGFFAHPMFHAAMRRDCDGDEASASLLMDGFLNFSRQYLPNRRGAKTMDAPLVLTSKLIPTEVDDQAHGLDTVYEYPMELYEAAAEYKNPWDVPIEQIKNRLNTPSQYEGMGFTHDTTNINEGISCSAYKILPSMQEKLFGQMEIAVRVRAVDEADVARLVIEKHFLKDIKGNLRKFSMQKFRCVACNEKYRRPPLVGKCTSCGGKIIFTISEGSVIKYLEPSLSLGNKYNVSPYLKQTLELLQRRVDAVFGKEKEKQTGLGDWFG